jgi:lipid A ethanolaminephosphotransferase
VGLKFFSLFNGKTVKTLFTSKPSVSSGALIAIAALYFSTILNLGVWRLIFNYIDINGVNMAIFALTLPVLLFAVSFIFFSLLIAPYISKPIVIALLLISAGTNYMAYYYGVYIDANMLRNLFQTNQREALDLITPTLLLWILFGGVAPAVLLAITKIDYRSALKEIKFRAIGLLCAVITIALIAAVSYKEYASFGRNNREVQRLISPFNYIWATARYFQIEALSKRAFVALDENARWAQFDDVPEDVPTVLVFVVGETARAANFSLNGYGKETNPLLTKQDVVNFSKTVSCGTATAVSVPCMFSHMDRRNFNDNNAKFTENILDLAKRAGYDILWLENDDGCKGVCDRVPTEIMIRRNDPKYCDGRYCYDEAMLEGLAERLSKITQNTIIVMHTIGSHGPTYYKRYPDRFKRFAPTCDTAEIQNCSNEAIVNTYDNTILYTDYIVDSAIEALKKYPFYESGLLYVSDHGESLGENNVYLHGVPYIIAPNYQTEVPMILWFSEAMKRYDHIDYECLRSEGKSGSYSHDNIFHSLLGLLEIKTERYDEKKDVFLSCRTKPLPF